MKTFYGQLTRAMNKAMTQHPHQAVALSTDTFQILATARDSRSLGEKLRRRHQPQGSVVVFQKPKANTSWVL